MGEEERSTECETMKNRWRESNGVLLIKEERRNVRESRFVPLLVSND